MQGSIDVYNPAAGKIIGTIINSDAEDVSAAVDNAKSVSEKWENTSASQRAVILIKAASIIRAQADSFAVLLTTENGKPLREAKDEILGAAHVFEYYASMCGAINGDAKKLPKYGYLNVVRRPIGICGAVIPWNMPVIIFSWKAGAALCCADTVIVKPSKTSSLTVMAVAEALFEAGVPRSVLQILTGSGKVTGDAIIRNKDIRHISFTGSVSGGIEVSKIAASNLKKLILELGGNDPFIVTKSADINKAVSAAVKQRFYNCGQVCTSPKRIIVHESVADEFIRKASEKILKLKVGSGLENSNMGPMNNPRQRDIVEKSVNDLADKGAVIVSGGKRIDGDGYFFEPTLIKDVSSELIRDEIFGPVMPVITFSDNDEAVSIANDTDFGLGASVWTDDIASAKKFSQQLDCGVVWINMHLTLPPEMPFGGVKNSGYGRENGYDFIYEYTQPKSILFG